MQRLADFFLSFLALVLLSPLLIPIVLILKITGEGEVFYHQKRIGLNGGSFYLLKFATMLKDSPNLGTGEITLLEDPRVLPFGKFLRKTKLNELPQIWNILKGEMSIVGPRPMVPNTFSKYSALAKEELSEVRPGLTGIGSIIFRDEEKYLSEENNPEAFYDEVIIPYKNEVEIWYVKKRSIFLYFKIIFVTAWSVLFPNSCLGEKVFSGLPSIPDKLL